MASPSSVKSYPDTWGYVEPSHISGNASDKQKQDVIDAYHMLTAPGQFGFSIGRRILLRSVEIRAREDEPRKTEAKVEADVVVVDDMINVVQMMHGGCTAYLVDILAILPVAAAQGFSGPRLLSQSIAVNYHSPAPIGSIVRIVARTVALGRRSLSLRCELYNTVNGSLVASGTNNQMTNLSAPTQIPTAKL